MVQSSIIMRLIAQIPDEHRSLRELIRDQYFLDVEENANAAQVAFIDLVNEHEKDVKVSLADIGNMVGESINLSREGGVALRQLQSDFQTIAETVSGLNLDIHDIKQVIEDHSKDIESFRRSRDQSIAERKLHAKGLEDSKVDRAQMNRRLDEMNIQLKSIEEIVNRLAEFYELYKSNTRGSRVEKE